MDGFDQDEAEGERDEGTVIARSLLATKGDALEALEFADGLLDARPRFVEDFREESGSVGCSRAMRNDRVDGGQDPRKDGAAKFSGMKFGGG